MNAPSEQDRMDKLHYYVQHDPRLEQKIAADLLPGLYVIEIGGQNPFWHHHIDIKRLTSADLRAYAKGIVDEWEAQRGTT